MGKTMDLKGKKRKKNDVLQKSKNEKKQRTRNRSGPELPAALRRELQILRPQKPKPNIDSDEDNGHLGDTVYEYDEPLPQEETKKNKRFDPVDNLEYELPESFQDEEIDEDLALPVELSEEEEGTVVPSRDSNGTSKSVNGEMKDFFDHSDDDIEEDEEECSEHDDEEKHMRMIQEITGRSIEAFEGKKRGEDAVLSEAYTESEYNLSRKTTDGDPISIQDLLAPLHGKAGYSSLRKRLQQLEKKPMSIQPPLPKVLQERLERKVAYKQTKEDITKWEPLVKRNREASTIYFGDDVKVDPPNVAEMAAGFEPRTDFEKKIASLVHNAEVMEAHENDGSKLLELNKVSVEDVKERQNRLAKMRSLLFHHELKAKHIKKIKSKTSRRLLRKDRLRHTSSEMQLDPEAAKEYAHKQDLKRAEERISLRHKNKSKWVKHQLKRKEALDEDTRAAISEQLNQHALLTRKMNSMKDDSSTDGSSDEDADDVDELLADMDKEGASKLLQNAKEKILKVLEEKDEHMPMSGVFNLPFMVRGLKKREEAVRKEARLACEEFDSSLGHLEKAETPKLGISSGRRVFGDVRKPHQEPGTRNELDNINRDSDSEGEFEAKDNGDLRSNENGGSRKEVEVDPRILLEDSENDHEPVFKSFDDIAKKPGPKTTFEVAIFSSDSKEKTKGKKNASINNGKSSKVLEPRPTREDIKEIDGDGDADSEEEMVDGILCPRDDEPDYELPSQADLIQRAFAGDDVEGEFEKDKLEVLNEENPEPEKPVLLPGWGQWTDVQNRKGLPSSILEEHENARKKREDALKMRKDAHLKNVIISEKIDKKAEKFYTTSLPFPFKSKEVFEQSMRVPLGPEYNPATSFRALVRPSVVKRSGVIIDPIKFEEVNIHDNPDKPKSREQTPKTKKPKRVAGKTSKSKKNGGH